MLLQCQLSFTGVDHESTVGPVPDRDKTFLETKTNIQYYNTSDDDDGGDDDAEVKGGSGAGGRRG